MACPFFKRCLGGKNPVSLSKFSPLFLFFFGSKAENLSLAFHLAKKVLTTNHQAPAWEHNWSVGWTAAQVCHNVSVFHYLSSGSVSCPLPPSLSLSLSYWVTSSSLSLSLLSVCFSLWQPLELWLSTPHALRRSCFSFVPVSQTVFALWMVEKAAVVTTPTASHRTPPTPLCADN